MASGFEIGICTVTWNTSPKRRKPSALPVQNLLTRYAPPYQISDVLLFTNLVKRYWFKKASSFIYFSSIPSHDKQTRKAFAPDQKTRTHAQGTMVISMYIYPFFHSKLSLSPIQIRNQHSQTKSKIPVREWRWRDKNDTNHFPPLYFLAYEDDPTLSRIMVLKRGKGIRVIQKEEGK